MYRNAKLQVAYFSQVQYLNLNTICFFYLRNSEANIICSYAFILNMKILHRSYIQISRKKQQTKHCIAHNVWCVSAISTHAWQFSVPVLNDMHLCGTASKQSSKHHSHLLAVACRKLDCRLFHFPFCSLVSCKANMSSYLTSCLLDVSFVVSVVKQDQHHSHTFSLNHTFYICRQYLLVNVTFSDFLIEWPAVRTVLWLISILATAAEWLGNIITSAGKGWGWGLFKWSQAELFEGKQWWNGEKMW